MAVSRHNRQKPKSNEKDRENKKIAKQSKEFQEIELAAKRPNKLKPESKEKYRERTLKSMTKARQNKVFQE